MLGGLDGPSQEKVFVASGAEVRGYTKKGKQFLGFDTNLTESIQSMYVPLHFHILCQVFWSESFPLWKFQSCSLLWLLPEVGGGGGTPWYWLKRYMSYALDMVWFLTLFLPSLALCELPMWSLDGVPNLYQLEFLCINAQHTSVWKLQEYPLGLLKSTSPI